MKYISLLIAGGNGPQRSVERDRELRLRDDVDLRDYEMGFESLSRKFNFHRLTFVVSSDDDSCSTAL